ncbi:hypothetical protein [Metamycoplasma alkalescens]|nr:hypothetical protein [Metamycoplasma alkalescens]
MKLKKEFWTKKTMNFYSHPNYKLNVSNVTIGTNEEFSFSLIDL